MLGVAGSGWARQHGQRQSGDENKASSEAWLDTQSQARNDRTHSMRGADRKRPGTHISGAATADAIAASKRAAEARAAHRGYSSTVGWGTCADDAWSRHLMSVQDLDKDVDYATRSSLSLGCGPITADFDLAIRFPRRCIGRTRSSIRNGARLSHTPCFTRAADGVCTAGDAQAWTGLIAVGCSRAKRTITLRNKTYGHESQ